jgi:ubiquitin-protein ligase E3 D
MTLNNLLSGSTNWSPIVPYRRHSISSSNASAPTSQAGAEQSSSALQTLISNLRNRDRGETMVESHPSNTGSELFTELSMRVRHLHETLDPADSHLALTIISLLSHFDRLTVIEATTSPHRDSIVGPSSRSQIEPTAERDLFDTLTQQLSDLQVQRLSHLDTNNGPPVLMVEKALLWSQIDEELEQVVSMCKERTEGLPRFDHLPPQYDVGDYLSDTPPEYQYGARLSIDDQDSKARAIPSSSIAGLNEKTRLDFEAVTMAIDRLYLVAPQLHNQRVELKSAKVKQMENARRAGGQSSRTRSQSSALGEKREEKDPKELESLVNMLAKATDRKLLDQSVVLEGSIDARVENSRLRNIKKVPDDIGIQTVHSD